MSTSLLAHLLPALPGMTGPKTYAAWPVWKDSTAQPVTFQPMPKKAAVKLYHRARDFETAHAAERGEAGRRIRAQWPRLPARDDLRLPQLRERAA